MHRFFFVLDSLKLCLNNEMNPFTNTKSHLIGFLPEDKTYFTDNRSLRRSVPPFYAEFFRLCFHSVIFVFFLSYKGNRCGIHRKCHRNGRCVNGDCRCKKGYTGDGVRLCYSKNDLWNFFKNVPFLYITNIKNPIRFKRFTK